MTGTKNSGSREIALDALTEILEHGAYSHIVLKQALSKYQYLEKQERAFITRTVEGTLEYLISIDYVIDQFSKTKTEKMKPFIRTLIRMGVYQLLYMDRVPDSAVCNESVKLAEKRGFGGLKGFVNGVLRAIARGKDNLVFPDESTRYSMPQWLISMWREQYDEETVKGFLTAFLECKPLSVRCNLGIAPKEAIIACLKEQKVTVSESAVSDRILYLSDYDYLESLVAFQKGYIQVQDLSSSLVGDVASPKAGDYVIDVCGAPGGKSIHIADLLKGSGMVEVRDVSDHKIQLVREHIQRTGFTNIRAKVWDALFFDQAAERTADIVIADLPCSGLGIIGKKPDIKYHMTPEKIDSLVKLQRDILSVANRYVKPGGLLVYSTCTIDKRENQENREWFLSRYPFEAVDIRKRLGDKLQTDTMGEGCLELLPGRYPGDGFFIAAMRRKDGEN